MDEFLQSVGEDVGKLMGDFTIEYIKALISSKLEGAMDSAVETVFPSGLLGGGDDGDEEDGGDDGGDDVVEQKGSDEKEDGKPLAVGIKLRGYKIGDGPDGTAHRYYDLACFSIKPKDSIIIKVVRKHGQLTRFFKSFNKQCNDIPKDASWPKKKIMKKNNQYYRDRYTNMDKYFETITNINNVTLHPEFLKYFELKYDPNRSKNLKIFMTAIESLCESNNINFSKATKTASKLGFDTDECEMLKVVAVEKLGKSTAEKLKEELNNTPAASLPGAVKNKFESKAKAKLSTVIAKAVEAGWNAAKEAFKKIVEKLNEVLDKGMDPIKNLFNKAMEPIGKIIKEKISSVESKLDVDDGLDKALNIARFPPLMNSLKTINDNNGKALNECESLIKSISSMSECYKYANYLMYNLGDPEIGQYIPFLDDIQDSHYRLSVGMTDLCYLLSRAAARSFIPLCKYIDFISDSYDSKEFEPGLTKALRECGRSLSSDYFELPSQIRRMSWRLPSSVTNRMLIVGQTTICQIADILGQIGLNWKPTSKDDVKSSFVKTITQPLDDFISNRVKLWTTVIRRGTEAVIADKLMSVVGDTIDKIAEGLNELCSALPDPLGENLKAGDIVKYLLNKMAENAVIKGVQMIASKTEKTLYDCNKFAEPADKALVNRLRYTPYIRPDNFDPADPAEDDNEDDEKEDKPDGIIKQRTNDNTADSDEEDGVKSDGE